MAEPKQADLLAKLHTQFRVPPDELVQQINKGTFTADAVGHADITDILLAHDPLWTWEPYARDESGLPRITADKSGRLAMWGLLTVHGHTRLEVGTALATSPDPLKELVGDFLRRGAMRFGVALALWSKSDWRAIEDSRAEERHLTATSGEVHKENAPRPGNIHSLPKPSDSDVARHPSASRRKAAEPVLPQDQALAMQAACLGIDDQTRQDVIYARTKGRTRSGKDLEPHEVIWVASALEELAAGIIELRYAPDGTPRLGKPRAAAGNNPGPPADDPF